MKRRLVVLTVLMAITAVLSFTLCACSGCSPITDVISCISGELAPPSFSHEAGKYDDSFTLTASSVWGTTIRYTLDGSEPTMESAVFPEEGLLIEDRSDEPNVLSAIDSSKFTAESDYTPPLVSKATVIRAAAFASDGTRGKIATATYLVGLDYDDIKVISLVLDSDSLFDYETGIYVFGKAYDDWAASDPHGAASAEAWQLHGNFMMKGREWERDVLVQVITEEGSLGIEQNMGIRIMGAASRRYYQKSFRLTAREEYGSKHFEYPLIDGLVTDSSGQPLEKYKSFVLRNGGNDNGYTFLRDPFIQSRVSDRAFATQASEPAIVFINGEYWGLYTITEDYSDNYVQYNYGVDNENVIMIKNGAIEEGTDEDLKLYEQLNNAIYSMDFTNRKNYDWLWTQIDKESFIDYMAVVIYINNEDGIFQNNNWRMWRARETDSGNEFADGKWRFMLYDTDMSIGLYSDGYDYADNTLQTALEVGWGWGLLLDQLMQVDEFREEFVNTFMDLRNTAFFYSDTLYALTEMQQEYEPYVIEQYERNGPSWVIQWTDIHTRFNSELSVIRKFINGRYGYAPKMLDRTLNLGEYYTLTLSTNDTAGGTVTVNTVTPDLSGDKWEGVYFSDYPVTLTATPASGYVFTGWSGAVSNNSPTVTVSLYSDIELTAVFEKE